MTQAGRSTNYTYDTRGRVASVTDARQRATEYSYDLADRMTAIKRPDGRQVTFTYDARGNLTSLTPPGRTAHTFAYYVPQLAADLHAAVLAGAGRRRRTPPTRTA